METGTSELITIREFAELTHTNPANTRVRKFRGCFPDELFVKKGMYVWVKRAEALAWLESPANRRY